MKKALLIIVGLSLLAVPALFAQQVTSMPGLSLNLNRDGSAFKNLFDSSDFLKGRRLMAGETYTLNMKFTASRAFNALDLCFVDNSEGAGSSYWREISDWHKITDVPAGQEVTASIVFTIGHNASSTVRAANKLFFSAEGGTGRITLNFSEFTLTKN